MPQLPDGPYLLQVRAEKYLDLRDAGPFSAPGVASVVMRPAGYGSLTGRFLYEDGTPVIGANVDAHDARMYSWQGSSRTDNAGNFTIDNLPAGSYRLLFTQPNGMRQWFHQRGDFYDAEAVIVTADAQATVTETVWSTSSVEVTVTDAASGNPLAGADVVLDSATGPQLHLVARSDAQGKATFTGVIAGYSYLARVWPPKGYEWGYVDDILVHTGQTTQVSVALQPTPPATALAVKIRDAHTGTPVEGACVSLVSSEDRNVVRPGQCSDADGNVVFDQSPGARWKVFVKITSGPYGSQWVGEHGGTGDPDAAMWVQTVEHQTVEVPVQLDPAGSIAGLVTDKAQGTPVSSLCPSVTPVPDRQDAPSADTHCTDDNGRYTIDHLGPYAWKVQFPDYNGAYTWQWSGNQPSRRAASTVQVVADKVTTSNARLGIAGKMTGQVVGAPWPYMDVTAVNAETGDYAAPRTTTTFSGPYTLSGLASQKIKVGLSFGSMSPLWQPKDIYVKDGRTLTRDLVWSMPTG